MQMPESSFLLPTALFQAPSNGGGRSWFGNRSGGMQSNAAIPSQPDSRQWPSFTRGTVVTFELSRCSRLMAFDIGGCSNAYILNRSMRLAR